MGNMQLKLLRSLVGSWPFYREPSFFTKLKTWMKVYPVTFSNSYFSQHLTEIVMNLAHLQFLHHLSRFAILSMKKQMESILKAFPSSVKNPCDNDYSKKKKIKSHWFAYIFYGSATANRFSLASTLLDNNMEWMFVCLWSLNLSVVMALTCQPLFLFGFSLFWWCEGLLYFCIVASTQKVISSYILTGRGLKIIIFVYGLGAVKILLFKMCNLLL